MFLFLNIQAYRSFMPRENEHLQWLGKFQAAEKGINELRDALKKNNARDAALLVQLLNNYIRHGEQLCVDLFNEKLRSEIIGPNSTELDAKLAATRILMKIESVRALLQECIRDCKGPMEPPDQSPERDDGGSDIRGGPPFNPVPLEGPKSAAGGAALEIPKESHESDSYEVPLEEMLQPSGPGPKDRAA